LTRTDGADEQPVHADGQDPYLEEDDLKAVSDEAPICGEVRENLK